MSILNLDTIVSPIEQSLMKTAKKNIKIILLDLAHTYYGISPSTVPIGVGYIAATLKKQFATNVDIDIFKHPLEVIERIKQGIPAIVGFGLYHWNGNLSNNIAAIVKKVHPGALLVAGGLSIPNQPNLVAKQYCEPSNCLFDIFVPLEGELPMASIVDRVLNGHDKRSILNEPIPGCYTYNGEKLIDGGSLLPPILDDIPSPYLDGTLDKFLDDHTYIPIVQTMRGCPYSCTFCVGGKNEYSKLRQFPIERVKEEIIYLMGRSKNRTLRLTDENFGIYERDVEIARFLRKLSEEGKYPSSIKVYTDKSTKVKVREVMLALKDFIPFNISLQSITPSVLKNIKRKNLKSEDIREGYKWAKKNRIITATELIHGFPGETYESYMESVNQIYNLKVDSAASHEVWLLPNTDLASEETREKYNLGSKYCLGDDALTIIDGEVVCEYDEHIVSTNKISIDQHYKLCQLDVFVSLTLYYGYFRELTYHALNYQVAPTDIFNELINNSCEYPLLYKLFDTYIKKIKNSHFTSKEKLRSFLQEMYMSDKRIEPTRAYAVFIGEFVFAQTWPELIKEYSRAIIRIYRNEDADSNEFAEITSSVEMLTERLVINPLDEVKEVTEFNDNFDYQIWVENSYDKRLSEYRTDKPLEMKLCVQSYAHIKHLIETGQKLLSDAERIQNFYRHLNTSSVKRVLRRA